MYASPSPISRLPVELLSEIFSFCTLLSGEPSSTSEDDGEYSPPAINSETVRVPFVLSRVNRRWRSVVLSQSSIWSNLCITAELIENSKRVDGYNTSSPKNTALNTNPITLCLERSRRSALNILIDVRDPEWNFSEAGVSLDDPEVPSTPALFSSENMGIVMSLLVPHLFRWRCLTILTDTWEPMHVALSAINPAITSFGAPSLESLTLMRCNDFVSFSPQFQPEGLKHPAFLSRFCPEASTQPENVLPKLKELSLRGVHVDWDSLASALSSHKGLASLELASHCANVRPSKDQFRTLLSSVPALRRLVVSGSGPEITEEMEEGIGSRDYPPVALHRLESLNIGYRTTMEGRTVLELLDAPNVKAFTLEDATYPGDPEEINGGSLLTYVGSKRFIGNETAFRAEYPPPSPLPQPVGEADISSKHIRRRKSSASSLSEESNAAFPSLENVTLKSVKSSAQPLRTFFNALSGLQKLELVGMSMQSVQALLPASAPSSSSCPCPCPQLQSLCVKDYGLLQVEDLEFVAGSGLATERETKGASRLRELDIHIDSVRAERVVVAAAYSISYGTKISVITDEDDEDEDEDDEDEDDDEDMDECTMDMDTDPFKPGGAFNDPLFDQYYSAQMFFSHNSH